MTELIDSQGRPLSNANGKQQQTQQQTADLKARMTARQAARAKQRSTTSTGNAQFDAQRPEFHDFDSKAAKPERGSILAVLGDIAVKIKEIFLDPNLSTTVGLISAAAAVSVSGLGYVAAFSPHLFRALAVPGIAPAIIAPFAIGIPVLAAFMVQRQEIVPILPKIFPKEADKLSFKLGLQKFTEVTPDQNQPTLLRSVKGWARKAAQNNQRTGELVRWGLYGFEFFMAMGQFGGLLLTGSVLSIAVVFLIAYGVVGCEVSLRYVAGEEQKRLSRKESQQYALLKRGHLQDAQKRIK
jgi:hypothetical protein